MSIKNTIANCRRPFARGSSREAFYSKKYNLVIKKRFEDGNNEHLANAQTIIEEKLFHSMTEAERQFFPVVGFATDNQGNRVVIMNKIEATLNELGVFVWGDCFEVASRKSQMEMLSKWKKQFNLKFNATKFVNTIKKYGLSDLHSKNMGIYDGKLVIIDFGWEPMAENW